MTDEWGPRNSREHLEELHQTILRIRRARIALKLDYEDGNLTFLRYSTEDHKLHRRTRALEVEMAELAAHIKAREAA
jgi:hypothetical protein